MKRDIRPTFMASIGKFTVSSVNYEIVTERGRLVFDETVVFNDENGDAEWVGTYDDYDVIVRTLRFVTGEGGDAD